jgi:riboflavin transporter FmnP
MSGEQDFPIKGVRESIYVKISLAAVFGALAAVISLMKFSFPMVILVYLKFDLAEIPDLLAYLIGGMYVGVLTAFIHGTILNISAANPIFGPLAKFLAVVSMMIGISMYRRMSNSNSIFGMVILGTVIRIIIMTVYNLALFLIFVPGFVDYIASLLSPIMGDVGFMQAIIAALIITAVYNAIHTVLSVVVSVKLLDMIRRFLGYRV